MKRAWREIERGVKERKHPFHQPTFATIADTGPSTRTVILRRFWRKPAQIAFHTHIGSPKVAEIQSNPNVMWHFYDPNDKFQLRIRGLALTHHDDALADEQWERTRMFARRCYVGTAPTQKRDRPDHGMPKELVHREPTEDESVKGRESFCVVTTRITYVDLLELDVQGHRRAFFDWDDEGQMHTGWLTP